MTPATSCKTALAYAAEISSERFLPLAVGDGRE